MPISVAKENSLVCWCWCPPTGLRTPAIRMPGQDRSAHVAAG
jgi:hypothetical protein